MPAQGQATTRLTLVLASWVVLDFVAGCMAAQRRTVQQAYQATRGREEQRANCNRPQ